MENNVEKFNFWETLKSSIRSILKPKFIREWTAIWKEEGFWTLVKKKGWKIAVAIIVFYLIRDSILYLLLPYLVYRGLIGQ